MLNIITTLLDLIFPPREGELVVRTITTATLPDLHRPGTHGGIAYISNFQNLSVRTLITENKYYGNNKATAVLAQLLTLHLKDTDHCVLIPIPLHQKRERERGYNQVTVVLQQSNYVVNTHLIARTKYTASQTTLNKSERLKNLIGAFTVNERALRGYEQTHFILVDDVVTTSATMAAAKAALEPHIPLTCTLTCLALAH